MKQKLWKNNFGLMLLISFLCLAIPIYGETAPGAVVNKCEYKTGRYEVEYPQFDGMPHAKAQENINAFIKQVVDKFISENNHDNVVIAKMDYRIHLNTDDKLSVSLLTYTFSGGAHGMSYTIGYTFDLKTGKRYSFSDLFNFDSESRQKINKLLLNQIRERDIPIFEPFQGISDTPNFYLEEGNKVVIIFGHYEIAPYAAGILEFPLTYKWQI